MNDNDVKGNLFLEWWWQITGCFLLERDKTETVWSKPIMLMGIELGGQALACRFVRVQQSRNSVAYTNHVNGY